jgi:hypothetical protein
MSWPEDFHPEVGYLLPSTRIRRIMRVGLVAAGLGLTAGIGGTLALHSPHENAITVQNGQPTMVDELPPDGREAISADVVPTKVADIKDTPGTLRRFSSARAQSSHCFYPFPSSHTACSFHRTGHSDLAAGPEWGASQAMGKALDEKLHQSERAAPMKQGKRWKPAFPSDHAHQYASPGLRYGERASLDRGGFW